MAVAIPKFFFINGELVKKLRSNRTNDHITVWAYTDLEVKVYSYSHVLRNHKKAYRLKEVSGFLNRGISTIKHAYIGGAVKRPQYVRWRRERDGAIFVKWPMFSEDDIMELYDYFSSIHMGRPRADGMVSPKLMPTRREVRAAIHGDNIMYVKTDDGQFIPTFQAERF